VRRLGRQSRGAEEVGHWPGRRSRGTLGVERWPKRRLEDWHRPGRQCPGRSGQGVAARVEAGGGGERAVCTCRGWGIGVSVRRVAGAQVRSGGGHAGRGGVNLSRVRERGAGCATFFWIRQ
jgi:hypothetical protein